jgi:hypothetical protein
MLTDDEIKALLEGCEGVTPGPWVPWGSLVTRPDNDNTLAMCYPNIVADDDPGEDLATHIARCDPQTIAELCTRLLSAEAKVKELEKAERAAYERGRQDASPTLGISPLR